MGWSPLPWFTALFNILKNLIFKNKMFYWEKAKGNMYPYGMMFYDVLPSSDLHYYFTSWNWIPVL